MFASLRRTRLTTALIALISLMFMQLAVASYVCPVAGAKAFELSVMAKAGLPCAGSASMNMDNAQPNICQAHCQSDQQSAHTHHVPPLVGAVAASFFYPPPVIVPMSWRLLLQAPLLRRSTAPALAVRYCCFRI